MSRWTADDITRLHARGMVLHAPTKTIALPDYKEVFKKVKKHIRHEESELQQTCVKTFRLIYPKMKKRLFSIPNGSYRTSLGAAILIAEGVYPGVSDVFLAIPKGKFGAARWNKSNF